MTNRLSTLAVVATMALALTACEEAVKEKAVDTGNKAVDTVQGVERKPLTQGQQDSIAKSKDDGLVALEGAKYTPVVIVASKDGQTAPYVLFKTCGGKPAKQCLNGVDADSAHPDVLVNLLQAPTDDTITPNGTYALRYPTPGTASRGGIKCDIVPVQGKPGLTEQLVKDFGEVGSVVDETFEKAADGFQKVLTVSKAEYNCSLSLADAS